MKRISWGYCLAVIFSFSVAVPVYAGEEPGWRFNDLKEITLSSYPELISKLRTVDAALADLEGAEWQRYPVPAVQTGLDSDGTFSKPVLSLQQPLWTGGRITAGIEAAQARHGAASAEVQIARRGILLRFIKTYCDFRRRQAQLDIHRLNVKRHEGLREMIERRVKNQVSPEVDLSLATSRLLGARNELSQTVQSFSSAMAQMSELVGRKVTRLDLTENIDLSSMPKNLEESVELARSNAPGLVKMDFELLAAQADIDSAEAAFWPKVVLRVEERTSNFEHKASISVESQLGAGLSTVANVSSAQSKRQAMAEDRQTSLLQLHTTVNEIWNTFVGSRYRLDNNKDNRKTAEAIFESYTRLYVAGQKSWLDVMNSAKETFSTSLTVEDTEAERLSAGLSMLVYTGRL